MMIGITWIGICGPPVGGTVNVFSNEPFAVTSSESCWPTVMVPSAEMLFGRNAKGRHGMYRKSMRAWKSLWSGMPSVTVPLACPLALPLN